MYVFVFERVLGEVVGVDGGWLPLPTRPQQYCDPTSLVSNDRTNADLVIVQKRIESVSSMETVFVVYQVQHCC